MTVTAEFVPVAVFSTQALLLQQQLEGLQKSAQRRLHTLHNRRHREHHHSSGREQKCILFFLIYIFQVRKEYLKKKIKVILHTFRDKLEECC